MTTNEREALLPCPFCGGEADYDQMPDDGSHSANKWNIGCIDMHCYGYEFRYRFERKADALKAWNTRAALQSVAQPINSVSDALNFLEEWALSGNALHGDDIQRFHAAVERLAPIAQPGSVPDRFSRRLPKESHLCVYINGDGKCQECSDLAELELIRQRIEKAIVEHCTGGDLWLCSHLAAQHTWAMLSISPKPQQAVPDGWKLVPIYATQDMASEGYKKLPRRIYGDVEMWDIDPIWDAMLSAAPEYNGKKDE